MLQALNRERPEQMQAASSSLIQDELAVLTAFPMLHAFQCATGNGPGDEASDSGL